MPTLGNIASEVAGAATCCILVKAMLQVGLDKWKLRPLVTCFVATVVSGALFTYILMLVLGLPLHVWIYAMLPVVLAIGVVNAVVIHLMYESVRKLFYVQEDDV